MKDRPLTTNLNDSDSVGGPALAVQVSELRVMLETRLDELRSREVLDAIARVTDVERKLSEQQPSSKGPDLDTILKVTGAIMPILLLLIGFFLIDTVKFAFEERRLQVQEGQLDLAAVQGMRDLLEAMRAPDVDEDVAKVNALLVAGYGVHGISPLITDLDLGAGSRRRVDAAVEALKSYVFSEYREEVCKRLGRVIATPRFTERGLERTVELVGYLNCRETVPDLERIEQSGAGDSLVKAARDAQALLTRPRE